MSAAKPERHSALRTLLVAVCITLTATTSTLSNRAATCLDDAMLVFDASRSMLNVSNDTDGRARIDEARSALRDVLPQIAPFRNLGLVVYGPGRQDVCGHIDLRLSPSANAAARIMAEVDRIQPDGDTPLAMAVSRAADTLRERGGPGSIVLITDGRETCGGQPCILADTLAKTAPDLTVHIIGFKTQISSFEWQSFGADDGRNTLFIAKCLADKTDGIYASAQSTDDLVKALQDILACPAVSRKPARLLNG